MTRIPEPDQTPSGPAYEGRLLDRADEEVVDQGAAFDMRTLVTRRGMLSLVGLGVGAVALAACTSVAPTEGGTSTEGGASTGMSAGEIPEETNGPYPADGTNDVNVLDDSGIVRSDITSSLDGGTTAEGVPMTMAFALTDMVAGAAFAGAAVYVWHCDTQGRYSMYSPGVESETYLRGIQVADARGEVTFRTIVPGCYAGRWTHIHVEVYPDLASATDVANVIATSQVAFPPEMLAEVYAQSGYSGSAENLAGVGTRVADDGIFGDGDWSLQVPTVSGALDSGYAASLAVAIDTTTAPGGGMDGGGGGRPSGGARGVLPPS